MDTDIKQRAFTIYLIKDDFTQSEHVITKPTKEFPIEDGTNQIGILYVATKRPDAPQWAEFFDGYVSRNDLGLVATSSAVLVVRASDRLFAITFGHGRYLLLQDSIEERFGLKVVLNSIPPEKLKSIDKKSFDAIDSNSRVQSSQEAEVQGFGIDAEQDLLRAVTGTPSDQKLGNRISGRDALHVVARIDISEIPEALSRYYEKYLETGYKVNFPWVENILEVSDTSFLDEKLVEIMNDIRTSTNSARCWLAIPEVIDWERVNGFKYSSRQEATIHHDLHMPGFFRSLSSSELLTLEELKRRSAYAVDGNNFPVNKWPIYKCIHCEIETEDSVFILSAGKWYAVTKDLSVLVNSFFNSIPIYDKELPQYEDSRESEYCIRVADASNGDFLLMDQNFVRIAGRSNDIEFCDLYSQDKKLIHVKRYGASKVLNHLFAQGLLSGECLKTMEGFTEELNKKLPEKFKIKEQNIPRNVSDFTIVFAIISESEKPLDIPFFARVTLRQVAKRLQSIDFSVRLAKISVSTELSRVERIPPRKIKPR